MKIYSIIAILAILLVLFAAFLAPGFSIIMYWFSFLILIVTFLVTITLCVLNIIDRDYNIKLCMSSLILLIVLICSRPLYDVVHGYHEVKKYLDDTFKIEAKILSIADRNVDFDSDGNNECSYTYNVQLDDDTGVRFQAGYCDIGMMWTNYDVTSNYVSKYLKYYYNLFKDSHNISFELKSYKENEDLNDVVTIEYNNSSEKDLHDFVYYVRDKFGDNWYRFNIYNIETNKRDTIYSSIQ